MFTYNKIYVTSKDSNKLYQLKNFYLKTTSTILQSKNFKNLNFSKRK